jgi:hypothetical protein
MSTTAPITRAEALAAFEGLSADDKWWMAENIMSILRGAGPLKPRGRKPKTDKDSGSESSKKRSPANLHNILTHVVKPTLTAASEAADEKTARLMKKGRAQKAVAQVFVDRFAELDSEAAKAAVAALTAEETVAVFQEWLQTPDANKPRKPRSTASSGSDSKPKKAKLADMTEEEKKAFYKARGEAAAAARAAKKAAAAESADSDSESEAEAETVKPAKTKKAKKAAEPEPEESENEASDSESEADEDAEPVAVRPYIWEHAMEGKESKKYERADIEGKAYLCHAKTKEYLGMWNEKKNKIDKSVPNPFA